MDIKASKIEEGKSGPGHSVIVEPTSTYDPTGYEELDMEAPDTLRAMIRDIGRLGTKEHIEIYKSLRATRPATYFAVNSLGAHFNILSLDVKERRELYRVIQMCKADNERQKIISHASEEHQGHMKVDESKTPLVPCISAIEGPSEHDKLAKMLLLNEKACKA